VKEIIKWLRTVELLAQQTYLEAAGLHAADQSFAHFLERLADDEAGHYRIMQHADTVINGGEPLLPAIALDVETSEKILNYFYGMKRGITDGSLTKEELFECIVQAELSEWNDIFVYVVNTLKERMPRYKSSVAGIQSHLKTIEMYVEERGDLSSTLNKIKKLPPVWIEKILIVEDMEMIADLIKALLNRDGDIDIARDGEEGLRMIEEKYYKLVISDIDMPKMNGIEMYTTVVRRFPKLKERFILMSGDISPERKRFILKNKLKFLAKPMNIRQLRELCMDILLTN